MSKDWLATLEERVRAATQEIARLRTENKELRARIGGLEAGSAASDDGDWAAERDEIRGRVEKLVGQLEGLLDR